MGFNSRFKGLNIWEEIFPDDGKFKYTRIKAGIYSLHTEIDSVSSPSTG